MHQPTRSILTILILLAALLALSATPALAQKSGKLNLQCMTFIWQVQGDNVQVQLSLNNHQVGQLTLTADNPIQQVNYKQGNCGLTGSVKEMAKSVWGQGSLIMNLTITQGSSSYGHEGTVATW